MRCSDTEINHKNEFYAPFYIRSVLFKYIISINTFQPCFYNYYNFQKTKSWIDFVEESVLNLMQETVSQNNACVKYSKRFLEDPQNLE